MCSTIDKMNLSIIDTTVGFYLEFISTTAIRMYRPHFLVSQNTSSHLTAFFSPFLSFFLPLTLIAPLSPPLTHQCKCYISTNSRRGN
ncbi:hypothetical protein BDF14DRAFT_1757963, partial [Spinellus fusiger]